MFYGLQKQRKHSKERSFGRFKMSLKMSLKCDRMFTLVSRGRLDLAVLFTPSTPNRQNRNQVRLNTCAGVRQSTSSSDVV